MEQLLQIQTNPMKYEIVTESAKLEIKQEFQPEIRINSQQGGFEHKTTPQQLRIDTYEQRRSLGMQNNSDFVKSTGNAGTKNIASYISQTAQTREGLNNIENDVTIGQIVQQRIMTGPPSMTTVFLPTGRASLSWTPGNLETNYKQGKVNFNFNFKDVEFEYSPPSAKINILSHASVDIEYVGSPLYVPASANPDYVETSSD